jgi:hypothetical protein
MKTVWIYIDTRKHVGDRDYLKVFADPDTAEVWFAKNDPEGVAFEYDVIAGSTLRLFEKTAPAGWKDAGASWGCPGGRDDPTNAAARKSLLL